MTGRTTGFQCPSYTRRPQSAGGMSVPGIEEMAVHAKDTPHNGVASGGAAGCLSKAEELDTSQGASQVEQPLENVRPSLVADAETPPAEEPCLGVLDHPPIAHQTFGGVAPLRAMRGVIPRVRRARRWSDESYALSAWSLA